MEGGKEPNYWPGFVDALSNVVLTLVFVLVVFVFALLMSSNKVEKKMNEVVASQKAQKAEQAELDKALNELAQIRADDQAKAAGKAPGSEAVDMQQACLKFNKSDDSQKATVDATGETMVVTFGANAISITDDTSKAIHDFIEGIKTKTGNASPQMVIESSDDPTSASPLMSRETELGRILNARNLLLTNKVEPKNISVHNSAPAQESGTFNWVKIYVQK